MFFFVKSYSCISTDESLPENSVSKTIHCLRFSKNNEIIQQYTENKKKYNQQQIIRRTVDNLGTPPPQGESKPAYCQAKPVITFTTWEWASSLGVATLNVHISFEHRTMCQFFTLCWIFSWNFSDMNPCNFWKKLEMKYHHHQHHKIPLCDTWVLSQMLIQ